MAISRQQPRQRGQRPLMYGRDRELAQLHEILDRTINGHSSLLPLDTVAHMFYGGGLGSFAKQAADLNLPATDQAFWERLRDPEELERFLYDPDCCIIEVNILAVGMVPSDVEIPD